MNYWSHTDQIQPGDIYVCLPKGDAHIKTAYDRGAVSHILLNRREWAKLAQMTTGNPDQQIAVVGITGTNGKTSVASFVTQCLTALGYKPYQQGTLTQELTTPDIGVTYQAMADHLANGGTHFVMEVSSHAIDQDRVHGINFAVRALTNISRDHLDYHRTMRDYSETKWRFVQSGSPRAVVPSDHQHIAIPVQTHTVMDENYRVAKGILQKLGVSDTAIDSVLATVTWPEGRLQTVCKSPCRVIVDFAHTPDALTHALQAARQFCTEPQAQLWVVFGCGGDRDLGKRAPMGAIAAAYADYSVLTNDNPRSEDPATIAADIQEGINQSAAVTVILDRVQAIRYAIEHAQSHDVVLVAGKGHERTQVLHNFTSESHDPSIIQAIVAEFRG
ncbi:MAG: UDP-N-acetylmuramoyl-L-alanyl-D-glutamate--2,6-diaminopimelate ligase [Candidatus Marinamargulisbacteria bacterium]|nr:UDP-N-acetylmuramoyl-L-alanyl-D-glutamate--2,6-diaminopimelate ligase [Candidatus Marinamargulisbacteria bacterium]